jgi:hypothetical protein
MRRPATAAASSTTILGGVSDPADAAAIAPRTAAATIPWRRSTTAADRAAELAGSSRSITRTLALSQWRACTPWRCADARSTAALEAARPWPHGLDIGVDVTATADRADQ